MKTDAEIQKDVLEEIKWIPLVRETEIGVTVLDGIVTLTGTVDLYRKKIEAEKAAKRVEGVKAVVTDIFVDYSYPNKKSDVEIAKSVLKALENNATVPKDKIKVRVEDGFVTLDGEVAWDYQRQAAKKSINSLYGVVGVHNNIQIKSEVQDDIEKTAVENALRRNSHIPNSAKINIDVKNYEITLTGNVHSWIEKEEAGKTAYYTPGVQNVNNDIHII